MKQACLSNMDMCAHCFGASRALGCLCLQDPPVLASQQVEVSLVTTVALHPLALLLLAHTLIVALLNIEPLGTFICGGNNQDPSVIPMYFSHLTSSQVVQYLARLRYVRN
jgi:hypothetical protein